MSEHTELELAILCRVIRATHKDLGYRTFGAVADELTTKNRSPLNEAAVDFLQRHIVPEEHEAAIANAAIKFVGKHQKPILDHFANREPTLGAYIAELLMRNGLLSRSEAPEGVFTNRIFKNWQSSEVRAKPNAIFRSGIYQIYRRHKPLRSAQQKGIQVYDSKLPPEKIGENLQTQIQEQAQDVVVTELAYIDSVTKECILVSSTRHVYAGSLHINARLSAFLLFQRQDAIHGFDHRFYCLMLDGHLPFYSAMGIRTGDKTGRPIVSECLVVDIMPDTHAELYAEFEALRGTSPLTEHIDGKSVILDYIASSPPDEINTGQSRAWKWVRRITDFPFLSNLVSRSYDGLFQFQEPIRAMDRENIASLAEQPSVAALSVFRHSDATPRDKNVPPAPIDDPGI